jgi:exodeoxyribonuclease-5
MSLSIPELNADQANAEDEFVDFLINPDEKEMRIIGPGGVGKSYLVSKLITRSMVIYRENCKILGLEPEYDTHALTAMTNKAAQSLSDATGLDVRTIHSYLSLAVKNNYTTGETDLQRTTNWDIKEGVIVFIDEAFMMDSKLLDELRAATMKCKLVFIGDDKQLDPIEGNHSPIERLQVRTAKLTIPVRNADRPELQALCQLLRDNVAGVVAEADGGPAWTWPMLPIIPGVIDHLPDGPSLKQFLDTEFLVPDGNKLITAFSNQRVNEYNAYLRELRGQTHLFEVGEVVISNDMYERGKFRIKNEQTVTLAHVEPKVTMLKLGDLEVPTQYVQIQYHRDQDIPTVVDRSFHKEAMKWARNEAKAGRTSWKPYYDLKDTFADFRPRDACTVHKSQGSTKDLVLIDLNNIGTCNFPVMAARLLYVAASRARFRVVFFGNLPAKYGGVQLLR